MGKHSLEVRHTIRARPEEIVRGLSDPSLFARWFMYTWGERAEIDFRTGGTHHVWGTDPKGAKVESFGRYTAIEPDRRVALTWEWSGGDGIPEKGERPITLTFEPVDGGTEVVFKHEGLETEASAKGHREAWAACLKLLEKLCEPGSKS